MIDLTPLDVRNKRGDFKKIMRGYDPQDVDVFLEIVAERLEALVRENIQLKERAQTLKDQVSAQAGREQAVQDALVTAQGLRADMQAQSQRESDHLVKEAEVEARRLLAEADEEVRNRLRGVERRLEQGQDGLLDLERRRDRFLKEFRGLLERELDVVQVEGARAPLEDRPIEMDLGAGRTSAPTLDSPEQVSGEDDAPEDEPSGPGAGSNDLALGAGAAASVYVADELEADVDSDDRPEPGLETTGELGEYAEGVTPEPLDPNGTEPAAFQADEAEAHDPAATIDVSDLQPSRPAAPPPDVGSEPSSLELELMAGAVSAGDTASPQPGDGSQFAGVPDLETVLAEAGVEEAQPPLGDEIAPPPVTDHDGMLLFDPDDEDPHR